MKTKKNIKLLYIYMNNVNILHKKGYFIIRNNNPNNINTCLFYINKNNTINYKKLNSFVHNGLLPSINQEVPILDNPIIGKMRFSNNTNSVDASTFHGDIYNHSENKLMPIYTCLIYFDNAQMEIIPGTHIKGANKSPITQFSNKKTITMNPGDMLIFHANIHHRGVGFVKNKNRRLLQIFNVFPDKQTHSEYNSKLITIKMSKSWVTMVLPITKILALYKPIINFINFIHYILVCYDLQYRLSLKDVSTNYKKGKYISYEPVKSMDLKDTNGNNEWNINIICDEAYNSIPPSNYYLNFFVFFICLIVLAIFFIKKKPHKIRRKRR